MRDFPQVWTDIGVDNLRAIMTWALHVTPGHLIPKHFRTKTAFMEWAVARVDMHGNRLEALTYPWSPNAMVFDIGCCSLVLPPGVDRSTPTATDAIQFIKHNHSGTLIDLPAKCQIVIKIANVSLWQFTDNYSDLTARLENTDVGVSIGCRSLFLTVARDVPEVPLLVWCTCDVSDLCCL